MIALKILIRSKGFQKVWAVMDRVHEKNRDVSEETIVKYATQAIAELREEKYVKSHNTSAVEQISDNEK